LASLQTQIDNLIPSQTGNSGKFLTTNGSVLSWASVAGGLSYQGTWNATTNTPTLASGVGTNGYYYVVSTAGSTNLDGITDWQIGDWLMFNGTVWQKIDQSNLVTSVNGQTGAVSLTTTNINEGTNLYYLDSRARQSLSAGTGISYSTSTGVITNSSPDQVVSLTGAGTTSISGTYPSFTITSNDQYQGTVTSITGTSPIVSSGGTTPAISIPQATSSVNGYLSSTDWTTFNNKGSGTVTSVGQSFTGGLISVSGSPITSSGTLALTVAGTSGGIPYFSSGTTWASSGVLTANGLVIGNGAGAAPSTTTTGTGVLTAVGNAVNTASGLVTQSGTLTNLSLLIGNGSGAGISSTTTGTGVVTALGVNTGSSGAFVVNGGALGTPSSGTVTNLTGTASININGTVGATTPSTGAFTTLSVNSNNISADNSLGFRNRIINGDMRIDQRNAGASVTVNTTGSTVFPVDRFFGSGMTSAGVFTLQRSTTAPTGFTNSMIATVTTADSSIAASDLYYVTQIIEGFNVADLGFGSASAKTVTLSFWVRSSVTGTFSGALVNSAYNRSYPFTYTISSANTFEYKTITITGDTSGTWLTDNGIGLRVYWNLGSGVDNTGTAGAWTGAGNVGADSTVALISTINATFYLSGVQLEVGSVATPFERRDYGRELALCQRYYEKTYNQGDVPGAGSPTAGALIGIAASTTNIAAQWSFKQAKRATPTLTLYSYNNTAGSWANSGNTDFAVTQPWGVGDSGFARLDSSGMTAGAYYWGFAVSSAEL
jgi:hypothetical protein